MRAGFIGSFSGLLLVGLSGVATAQTPLEPAPLSGHLQAGIPLRVGYAYRVPVRVLLENPQAQAGPTFELRFSYTTASGVVVDCHNLSLPSSAPPDHAEVRHPGLPGAGAVELSGELALPATWYRGPGSLNLSLIVCRQEGAEWRCPADAESAADPALRLGTELVLY